MLDKWYDLEDREGNIGLGKIRIILQIVDHVPPDYKKETELVQELIMEIEHNLLFNEEKKDIMEKPFGVFEVEKREKENEMRAEDASSSTERGISLMLYKWTKTSHWPTVLLVWLMIYGVFTCLT